MPGRREEVHVDAADLVVAELDPARAGAVVVRGLGLAREPARSAGRPRRARRPRRTRPPSACPRSSRRPPRRRRGIAWRASPGPPGSSRPGSCPTPRPRPAPDARGCRGTGRRRSRVPSSSTASCVAGSSDVDRAVGHELDAALGERRQDRRRRCRARAGPACRTASRPGCGPRRERLARAGSSSRSIAASLGAGGHLNGAPHTPTIAVPERSDGSASRAASAPANE